MGMSPFDAPGTYSLLQYTELAEGIWYPVGGFHRIIEAVEEVGRRKGVDIRLGTEVQKILLSEDGWFAQEPRFVAKRPTAEDPKPAEDDGFLLFYAFDEAQLDLATGDLPADDGGRRGG